MSAHRPVGALLRQWRERRRLSQLELAIQANISTRHLSFVETGRSRPTPQMILRLTEELEVPLRERNELLLAGGYAPAYPQHQLDEPELAGVRQALGQVLDGHQPYPALLVDRWYEVVAANAAVSVFLADCAPELLEPPINTLRLSLHPAGMAPQIVNLGQWREHLLSQLQRRAERLEDARLRALHQELLGYPAPRETGHSNVHPHDQVVLPLRYRHDGRELSFFSISSAVNTALDVTVSELAIEAFYPADADTAQWLSRRGDPA